MSRRRIFIAGLWHETNTFAPGVTSSTDFRVRKEEEIKKSGLDGSQLGAAISRAAELDWELTFGPYFQAKPAGIVSDDVYMAFMRECEVCLRAALKQGMDGVLLFLHGAMVSASDKDVEGAVLATVADILGDTKAPVAVVIDPHANVTDKMAAHAHILLSYRENPHTDAVETTLRACELLQRAMMSGITPHVTRVSTPILLPPPLTASALLPMRPMLDLARAGEGGSIWAINVCPGFAHADIPDAGLSFTIVHEEDGTLKVQEIATRLRKRAIELAPCGQLAEIGRDEAISYGLKLGAFPCLLVEPADNVGGGAPGDSTWILQSLLDRGVQGAGVVLCDPQAAEQASQAHEGDTIQLSVGGKSSLLAGRPVTVVAKVLRKTDGDFEVEDSQSHTVGINGTTTHMGRSVLLEYQGNKILLNSIKTMPVDLGQWKSMGVNPADLTFIGIKAAVAHRRAYDPIARQSFIVRTPGTCSSDLASLPYHHVRRPVYPLDALEVACSNPLPRL